MSLLLLALLPLASATQIAARAAPCPLGDGRAKVYEKVMANAAGGYDSDGATYASGGQWRAYRLATCESNLFTVYGTDIGLVIAPADRPRVEAALAAAVGRLSDRTDPPVWERYGLAAAVYGALGRGPLFLGDLWMEASWTARDEAVGYYEALLGPAAARALVDGGNGELQKPLSAKDRQSVLYNLARVAHRGGFGKERDAFLAKLRAETLDAAARAKVDRFAKLVGTVEPGLQDQALAAYEQALKGTLTPAERTRATYLVADLHRRRGRPAQAAPLFQKVAADEAADAQLREMAGFLVKDMAAHP